MKAQTLLQAKQQIHNFREAIQPIIKHWDSNKYTLLNVLLQNLSFNSVGTVGYNHFKDVAECEKIIRAIENLAAYETKCHVTGYIKDEVTAIWDGLNMSEEYES